MSSNEAKLEITPPKLFTKKAVMVLNAHGTLLLIPLLVAIPVLVLIVKFLQSDLAIVLCMVILGLSVIIPIYFFPIGIGNPYVRRLVRSMNTSGKRGFVVQLIRSPRIKSGFWAFMEDADDIGQLSFEDKAVFFEGDSAKLLLPSNQIRGVRLNNVGWRGLWSLGPRITVDVHGLPGVNSFEFSERCSFSLFVSRRKAKAIYEQICALV